MNNIAKIIALISIAISAGLTHCDTVGSELGQLQENLHKLRGVVKVSSSSGSKSSSSVLIEDDKKKINDIQKTIAALKKLKAHQVLICNLLLTFTNVIFK